MGGPVRRLAVLLGGGLFLLGGSSAHAARLLDIRVERDGQLILSGMYPDNGSADAGRVWSYLKDVTLEPAGEMPADPLRVTLTGNIRVAVLHVDKPVGWQGGARTDVAVEELRLVRPSPHSDRWQLAPGEVERTARAAGIQLPPPGSPRPPLRLLPRSWLIMFYIALAIVIIGVVVITWLLLQRRRRRRAGVDPRGDHGLSGHSTQEAPGLHGSSPSAPSRG